MADVRLELELARDAKREIENAENLQTALAHAFDGSTSLLLAILYELRQTRENSDII